jgi:hypothetical protein
VTKCSLVLRNKPLCFHAWHLLQASKDCVQKTLKRLEEKIHGWWVIVSIVFWCWDDIDSRHGGEVLQTLTPHVLCCSVSGTEASSLPHAVSRQDCPEKGCQHSCAPVFCWWPAYHIYWEQQELSFGLIIFRHGLFFSRERHVTAAFSDILTCCHSRDGGNANFIYQPETATWWYPCIMHTG